jgi:hypothetical protein
MSINEEAYKQYLQTISVDNFEQLFESAKNKPKDSSKSDSLEEELNYLIGYGSCADILLEFLPSKFKSEECFNQFIRGMAQAMTDIENKLPTFRS